MPLVMFFVGLDFEQKSKFLDGHYLKRIERNSPEGLGENPTGLDHDAHE